MTIRCTMIRRITGGALRVAALAGFLGLLPTIVHASVLSDLAGKMQPGEWKEVPQGSSFQGGRILVPAGGDGYILEYTDEATRNPLTKMIYIIGCAKADAGAGAYLCGSSTTDEDAGFVVYDEATNSWSKMPSYSINTRPHTYDNAALDPSNGDYYYKEVYTGSVWRLRNGQLTRLPDLPAPKSDLGTDATEFFPELGGLVVVNPRRNGGEIYLYSPSSNSWSIIPDDFAGNYSQFTEYNPMQKFLYFGGGADAEHNLYKLDVNKKVTRLADSPVVMGTASGCAGVQTVDPLTGKLIVFSCDTGNGTINGTYEYDPVANSWTKTGTHSLADNSNNIDLGTAVVPLHDYGVIFIVVNRGGGTGEVWLYKHSAGASQSRDTTRPLPPLNLKIY